jgi:hypothetical protein
MRAGIDFAASLALEEERYKDNELKRTNKLWLWWTKQRA